MDCSIRRNGGERLGPFLGLVRERVVEQVPSNSRGVAVRQHGGKPGPGDKERAILTSDSDGGRPLPGPAGAAAARKVWAARSNMGPAWARSMRRAWAKSRVGWTDSQDLCRRSRSVAVTLSACRFPSADLAERNDGGGNQLGNQQRLVASDALQPQRGLDDEHRAGGVALLQTYHGIHRQAPRRGQQEGDRPEINGKAAAS